MKPSGRLIKILGAILLVLLGLLALSWVFPAASDGPDLSKKGIAKSDAAQLVVALTAYRGEYDQPPGGDSVAIMAALRGDNPRKISFISIDPTCLSASGLLIDPWGSPYALGYGKDSRPWAYSFGRNKTDEGGQGDDIVSWK